MKLCRLNLKNGQALTPCTANHLKEKQNSKSSIEGAIMKKPRVVWSAKPAKPFAFGKWFMMLLWLPFKLIIFLLPLLPILFIVGLFLLPETPHLRWQYQYRDIGNSRVYVSCDYIGINGMVVSITDRCPFIAFL
jgi:hypothetical protein